MRPQSVVLPVVVAISALSLISCGSDESDKPGETAGATADIIRDVKIRLDQRCHVALLDVSLTRDAPVGLQFVGRVPFGRQRTIRLLRPREATGKTLELPLAMAQQDTRPGGSGVHRAIVWDLSYPNGNYLAPGTHSGKFRALDRDRDKVLDTFPVKLTIPKSFYKGSLDECGG